MNKRIFVEKKPNYDKHIQLLYNDLKESFSLESVKIYLVYDLFSINEKTYESACYTIFADPVTDILHEALDLEDPFVALEYLPGVYDAAADAAQQCLHMLSEANEKTQVKTAWLVVCKGLNINDLPKVKNHLTKAIDIREKNLNKLEITKAKEAKDIIDIEGFTTFSKEDLEGFHQDFGFSLDLADLLMIQQYFIQQKRNPTETELRVLDTYWSDHCRHTTFLTHLESVRFEGPFKARLEAIWRDYEEMRRSLKRDEKPKTLMDIATIAAKFFQNQGGLKNWHRSEEVNACTIEIPVDVDGKEEAWYLLFKNETHNHPTEIEPYGGAATCLGGAIRDPLSGRAFVYQAMRLSGAADVTAPLSSTLAGKWPQSYISKQAALGYSSYGNQIGLATTHVAEVYHDGYKAKRMEVGMVVGAVPKDWVRQESPTAGDVVLILGGATGIDGVGGASGSSKVHDVESIDKLGAEVQKGNPIVERKIQRLFRNKQATRLIKKCNDFGAGGVAVAIGELSRGIKIDLDKLPLKYEGLNATELALSESQERMAIVISADSVDDFIRLAQTENLNATPVATITKEEILSMQYRGKDVVSIHRSFLDTNGATKQTDAFVTTPNGVSPLENQEDFSADALYKTLSSLQNASQKGLIEMFDATVGATTVLMPLGGKHQQSPAEGSAQKIPVLEGETQTVSLATWGFHPELCAWSPLHGGAYAVVASVAKLVALGGDYRKAYFSFQEYFQKLGDDAKNWGQPLAALLGALSAQQEFGCAAIGGKDSMSGTFNDLHVPPTLISFAVATARASEITSTAFKKAGNYLYLYKHEPLEDAMPNFEQLKQHYLDIQEGIKQKKIVSAKSLGDGGLATCIAMMSFGNQLGAKIETNLPLLRIEIGSVLVESTTPLVGNALLIGRVLEEKTLIFNNLSIDLLDAQRVWETPLSKLFPVSETSEKKEVSKLDLFVNKAPIIAKQKFSKPRVFIPVFPGINCEYETGIAFQRADAQVNQLVFRNLTLQQINESIDALCKEIKKAQILTFAGGFSAGDEPDGSAKFITMVLRNERVKDAVSNFLASDGLILGICNGFQALIKSGLLPYGEITSRKENDPTLTFNAIGRHISQMARVKVINDHSPWLKGMKDKQYMIPFSHGEGRFYATDEAFNTLALQGQIATQYVDELGQPSMDMPYNPNGSLWAIEGITCSTGRIYGRMGHSERYTEGLLKNIPDVKVVDVFKNGVDYFI